jgi:hypothetical protein
LLRWLGRLLLVAVIVGIALQFVRPEIGNPLVTADLAAPEPVKAVLRKSCYNCHSNETRLSWFDQPAPAYWLVASDVRRARKALNFSEIGKLPAAAQKGKLYEAVNMVRLGAMPLPQYLAAHPEARVSAEDRAVLEQYLAPFAEGSTAAAVPAASANNVQAPALVVGGVTLRQILPELNGLPFEAGYQSWKPISTTDRGDNGTLRAILGNEIAVKAIAEKKVSPWPDGTAFAKVAWQADRDGDAVKAGKFIQVEFMVKDAARYKETAGWGWGRWRGPDLKPYGKDAHFTEECVGCHLPVKGNDYVYTLPVERGGL